MLPIRIQHAPAPPLIACQLREQLQLAQRRIGDPVRRALLQDVADRDAQRGTQREHSGDIHLVHVRFLSEVEGGSPVNMLGAPLFHSRLPRRRPVGCGIQSAKLLEYWWNR
jgi:hypothetical protein